MDNENHPQRFFAVSTFKFIVMSVCTLDLYKIYWFYKNWLIIKNTAAKDIMPFWRALFSTLWAYSCFRHIKKFAEDNNLNPKWPIGLIALVYFCLSTLWRLPDPYWLIAYLNIMPIVVMNSAISKMNQRLNPHFHNNNDFSSSELLAASVGGLVLVIVILGMFIKE